MAKFYSKRMHVKGVMSVDAGFRNGKFTLRVQRSAYQHTMNLSVEDAYDLADVLDEALETQEKDPLV